MSERLPNWLDPLPWLPLIADATVQTVACALEADQPDERHLAALLSPAAGQYLETLAQRARRLTQRHFGRTIALYAPLYLSSYCSGGCSYCGFAADRDVPRHKLSDTELAAELEALKRTGIEEVLLLTGERTAEADFEYVRRCTAIAARHMHKVIVEVFPMQEDEYAGLAEAGCTGLTVYQETYAPDAYSRLHRWGRKRDYTYRLDTPFRALRAGLRTAGIGVLLGLGEPAFDLLCLYRHARELLKRSWRSGVSISFPRIRPQAGAYQAAYDVDDRFLAQIVFAFRICLPTVPLVLSTRESAKLRDGLAGVGISKMSVASRTTVGGYSSDVNYREGQFEISDDRDVDTFCAALRGKELEPVLKNWDGVFRDPVPEAGLHCVPQETS